MKRLFGILVTGILAVGCGGAAARTPTAARPAAIAHWTTLVHVSRPLDVAGPRRDGSLVLAAAGKLYRLAPASGRVTRLALAYQSPGGEEPYIALPAIGHRGCSYGGGTVYALRLANGHGVVAISPSGQTRMFATLSARGLIDGIAFDEPGRFGYRLLVTVEHGATSTVVAIDCHGHVKTITGHAPKIEGGITVAPSTFGRFAGDLIASDENTGRIYAIAPDGRSSLVARSGLPHGGDTGVESEAFVPAHGRFTGFLADRGTPGNRHPGDDVVLRASSAALFAAGARPGDLLDATEGGAKTVAVHCGPQKCTVRHVADGPAIAHPEGHIAIVVR
ncbi:MAG TPA: hypothetical protein VJ741_08940 [Solirubrobacteraceae bacterium]|nr:hypothetical protein [Solirubrobacteraceae bacterium]